MVSEDRLVAVAAPTGRQGYNGAVEFARAGETEVPLMSNVEFQHIKANMVGDVAVVEVLTKELRFPAQAQELGRELAIVAAQGWAKRLLVNMRHVKYLSSTGFATLVGLAKQAADQASVLKFCGFQPEVRIGADIIGLDRLTPLFETEHEALESFGD
jgi:anti-anti-sigma factor